MERRERPAHQRGVNLFWLHQDLLNAPLNALGSTYLLAVFSCLLLVPPTQKHLL